MTINRNVNFLTPGCVVIMQRLIVSLDFLEFSTKNPDNLVYFLIT